MKIDKSDCWRSDNFERTFGIYEFSQKTNEHIRFYYFDEFGRIRGHQKVLSKLSDLYRHCLVNVVCERPPYLPLVSSLFIIMHCAWIWQWRKFLYLPTVFVWRSTVCNAVNDQICIHNRPNCSEWPNLHFHNRPMMILEGF